ncbi:hypothetical protein GZH53_13730 [Flavihumibacter sp. R14]|nr:hypothetical protein [Flavihumibacter soli]
MVNQFHPSTNILNSEFDLLRYIKTENVQSVFNDITANYSSGTRAFNLIGAYGTGKSTFLTAFESHINEKQVFDERGSWTKYTRFEVIKIVGEYTSLLDSLAEHFNCAARPREILESIREFTTKQNDTNKGVLLIIDEFGKFLEYSSKHDPEVELYFLQQLAEYANNGGDELLFISTLHQDFSGYGSSLTKFQRNEWLKVKGRFKEISFNEPVEQLIDLAGKRIKGKVPRELEVSFDSLFKCIRDAKAFPLKDYFEIEKAKLLYPLDILSSSVLALSLQHYGQNERSLFTFLDSHNHLGLHEFDKGKFAFYSIKNVHDYLHHNFNSFLKSKANPDYSKWASIRIALERVEGEFEYEQIALYQTIIKTVGLLNIFSHAGSRLDEKFLDDYINITSGLSGTTTALKDLERKKVIRFYKNAKRFVLFDSTEVDIDVELEEASTQLNRNNDVVTYLSKYFSFPTISAKRAYFSKGTPRIFQFKITETPYNSSPPQGEIDGFINLVFDGNLSEQEIKEISASSSEAVIYGVFKNTEDIKALIEEIEKAEIVKERHLEDRIVQREINQIIDIQKHLLNHYVFGSFYNSKTVRWYFGGNELLVNNSRNFNSELSKICEEIYDASPIFKSELANRSKHSPAVSTARKNFIERLFVNISEEDLGIQGFPPEKSIYRSLLKESKIHSQKDGLWQLTEPQNDHYNFNPLFKVCDRFIESSINSRRAISELYDLLGKRPFKLKKGFLDFIVPTILFLKRSDFALYGKNGFIPEIDAEVLELLVRNPKDYSVKAFDVGGVKIDLFNEYRHLLSLNEEHKTSTASFIQTISPFIKFYKELPEYTKRTKRLQKETIQVRNALIEATDPEKLFFEDFPNALGFDINQLNNNPVLLKGFTEAFHVAVKELQFALVNLEFRFEEVINSLWNKKFDFEEYKEQFRRRYVGLNQHLLLAPQKSFYQRLCSPLDDRSAWLSSICQAAIGKTLDKISDTEELKLQGAFLFLIHELDNLNEMSAQNIDLEHEDVFKLEITTPKKGLSNKIIRIPKKRNQQLIDLERELTVLLREENKFTKIAILGELLRKEIDESE